MNEQDTTPASVAEALAVAREAAAQAGEIIRHYWRQGVDVEHKADASPVTVADREAETAIRRILSRRFPDHAQWGEEHGREGESDYLWLIDPLDGTKSFVRRTPFFSTQIALMYRGELILGVSSAPLFGETLWASRGDGAFADGTSIHVADIRDMRQASISTGNIRTLAQSPRWSVLARLIGDTDRIRGYGDFCHYHLLAQGSLDLVIESDVNILDIAALAVIVREAGGAFTDLDGGALDLETRSVLAGVPPLHAEALARFQTAP